MDEYIIDSDKLSELNYKLASIKSAHSSLLDVNAQKKDYIKGCFNGLDNNQEINSFVTKLASKIDNAFSYELFANHVHYYEEDFQGVENNNEDIFDWFDYQSVSENGEKQHFLRNCKLLNSFNLNSPVKKIFQNGVITTIFTSSNDLYDGIMHKGYSELLKVQDIHGYSLNYNDIKDYVKGDSKDEVIDAIYYYYVKKIYPDLSEEELQDKKELIRKEDHRNHNKLLHMTPIMMNKKTTFQPFAYNIPIEYDGEYLNIYDPDMPVMKVALKTLKNDRYFSDLRFNRDDVITTSCEYYHDISLLQKNYTDSFKTVANNYVKDFQIIDLENDKDGSPCDYAAYCSTEIVTRKSEIVLSYLDINNNYDYMVNHTINHEFGHAFSSTEKYCDDNFIKNSLIKYISWYKVKKNKDYYIENNILSKKSFKNIEEFYADLTAYYFNPDDQDRLKQVETAGVGTFDNAYELMEYTYKDVHYKFDLEKDIKI